MLRSLVKNWWVLALKGVVLILFSIFLFTNPVISATVLALWFACLIMADGVFTIIAAFASWKEREDKWLLLAEGAISLFLGILVFQMPGITLTLIAFTIAFWFIFGGVSRIAMGIQVRKEIKGEGWIILGGILAVIFGLIIIASPIIGITYLIWIIAFTSLFVGLILIVMAFKLRKGDKWVKEQMEEFKQDKQDRKEKFQGGSN